MKRNQILGQLKNHTPKILGSEGFAKYSVLLPLIETEEGVSILFEVRAMELRRQPGEICFPGGRIDPADKDEKEAAIRETVEELGLPENMITNVYPLDYMISPFGMIVYPYAGFFESVDELRPNEAEVGEIFMVPLSFFMNTEPEIYRVNFSAEPEENFPFEKVPGGREYNWRTRQMEEYFFDYEGRIIWGLTARIVAHFIEMIKQG